MKALGYEGLRFHDLRHLYASALIAAGQSPKVVQERLGHASISETFAEQRTLSGATVRGLTTDIVLGVDEMPVVIVGSELSSAPPEDPEPPCVSPATGVSSGQPVIVSEPTAKVVASKRVNFT